MSEYLKIIIELFSNICSATIGGVIGGGIAYFIAVYTFNKQKKDEINKRQIETAIEYYEEMTSNEFTLSRSEASKVFEEYYLANNLDDFYSDLPEDKVKHIRIVTAYFRRLQLLVEYNQINIKMTLDLLADEFFYWYFMWLDVMVPDHWETRKNIDKLHQSLKKAMLSDKYEQLKKDLMKRREKRLRELQFK